MKRLIFIFFLPLVIYGQSSNNIGDVDCDGQLSSEDASLILQYVTNVIDSLPCQENIIGLQPDQIQELIEMMSNQININYNGVGFGDWIIKYDNPDFDELIFEQEQTDGFLIVQYSRENQSNSSSTFGFNIYTGSILDTINFIMDVTINIQSSWNPINSKNIPIKKGNYWVLKNEGGTNIDKVYFLPINEDTTTNSNNEQTLFNKNIFFPDGQMGSPITWSCLNNGLYTVPDGKNLYITQQFSGSDDELTIDEITLSSGYSNNIFYTGVGFAPSLSNSMPFIANAGQEIDGINFSGFLTEEQVSPITIDTSIGDYTVPDGKVLCILQYYSDDSSQLLIDNIIILDNYSNNIFYTGVGFTPSMTLSMPLIIGAGQIVSGNGNFNGYIMNDNYFE